jgi:hypothetical protein
MPTADKSFTDLQFNGPLPNDPRMLNAVIAWLGLAYVPGKPGPAPHPTETRKSHIAAARLRQTPYVQYARAKV